MNNEPMTHRTFRTAHIFGTCQMPHLCLFFLSFFPPTPLNSSTGSQTPLPWEGNAGLFSPWAAVASLTLGCCEAACAIQAGITLSPKPLPGQASGHPELLFLPHLPPGMALSPSLKQWSRAIRMSLWKNAASCSASDLVRVGGELVFYWGSALLAFSWISW